MSINLLDSAEESYVLVTTHSAGLMRSFSSNRMKALKNNVEMYSSRIVFHIDDCNHPVAHLQRKKK